MWLTDSKLLMVGIFSRNDRGICGLREVDVRVEHQVGLEFCQIQGSLHLISGISNGRHSLANKAVKVSVSWMFSVKVSVTDAIDGLHVCHEGTIIVPQGGLGGKDGVVEPSNSSGNLGGWVNGELQLGLLSAESHPLSREVDPEPGPPPEFWKAKKP